MSFSSLAFLNFHLQSKKSQTTSSQSTDIPFLNVLSSEDWAQMLQEEGLQFRTRVFSPLITLWTFVCQILSADHSCRYAVAQWVALQASRGQKPCSSKTAAYCRARRRIPESFYRRVTLKLAEKLSTQVPDSWKWKNREVKIIDGTTLRLPDTPANQKEFPPRRVQKRGFDFPSLRFLGVISLSSGMVLDAAWSAIRGKETGEPSLLRSLISSFRPKDVLLMDRYFCGYFNLAFLLGHGLDVVIKQNHTRNENSMTELKRFSLGDRIVALARPARRSFQWEKCPWSYDQFEPAILLREITFPYRRKGFRPRTIRVLTSLINPKEYSWDDILRLYAARWNIETDFFSMKIGLQMDELRCKTPEMIRKEIWAHLLTYNFARLVTAQAAELSSKMPRQISFQGTIQSLQAFRPLLASTTSPTRWKYLYRHLLEAVAKQPIGNRSGRYEPRLLRRRSLNTYPFFSTSRAEARKRQHLNQKSSAGKYAKYA